MTCYYLSYSDEKADWYYAANFLSDASPGDTAVFTLPYTSRWNRGTISFVYYSNTKVAAPQDTQGSLRVTSCLDDTDEILFVQSEEIVRTVSLNFSCSLSSEIQVSPLPDFSED